MRRVILAVSSTIVGLVLLLGFKTETTGSTAAKVATIAPPETGSTPAPSTSASAGSTTTTTTPTTAPSTSANTGTKTVTGDSADTRWGPVQVKITVVNGKITSAEAVDYPQNNQRDIEINSFAIPQLQQETIAASTANIDMVSGATYTSQGYLQSLQSALDKL